MHFSIFQLEMKFALWIGGLVMTIVGSLAALAFFGMPVLGVAALGGGLFVAGVAGMVVASKNLAEVNQVWSECTYTCNNRFESIAALVWIYMKSG